MSGTSCRRVVRAAAILAFVAGVLAGAVAEAQVTGTTWTPIGPAPLKGFFAGGVVGRATSIAVNPFNGDQVWLGTASGGIWYTPDGAIHWYPLTDDQAALAIGDIALRGCDASGCSEVFAGTGENAIRRDTYHGRGFLVGQLEAPGTPPVYAWTLYDGAPGADFDLGSINDVVTDPFVLGGGPIYVTLSSGVTSSASQSTLTAPAPPGTGYGVFRTHDTGASWTRLTIPGTEGAVPTDLEMRPGDNQTLYAGFLGVGLLESTDGGNTWCPLSPGIPLPQGCNPSTWNDFPTIPFDFVEIAIAPSDADTMYVTLGHCSDPLLRNCLPSVYRSTNGGDTWFRRIAGDPSSVGKNLINAKPYGYSRYTHALTVHPTNPAEVFLGGIRLWRTVDGFGTVDTADKNKAKGATQWGSVIHHDHHDVVFDPTNPARIYNTNDGGVYVTTNFVDGWVPRNNLGLQITGFHSLTLGPGLLIGGAQDNGILVYDGIYVWDSEDLQGDGGFTVVDAVDPKRWYALLQKGDTYSTPDQGGEWCPVNFNLPAIGLPPPTGEVRNMYAPFVQGAGPPHDLYWGGQSLYRSPRATGSSCTGNIDFTRISPILETGNQPEVTGGKDAISAIAVAPSNSNRVYLGYYGGGIYRTDAACDDSSCWTDVGAGLPDLPITRIAVHPTAPDTVIATLSGFDDVGKVWRSTDGGANWSAAVTGLPSGVPANTVHYEPGFPARVWLGMDGNPTGVSVFRSLDGGVTWSAQGFNLPNVPVYDMTFHEPSGQIFIGTHGRGAFVLGGGRVIKKEVWKDLLAKGIGFSGMSMPADSACSADVVLASGASCASGSTDAMGAEIRTDPDGRLVTDKEDFYTARPMAWACLDDTCIGGSGADACRDPGDPPARLAVDCGGVTRFVDLDGPFVGPAPRSVHLGVIVAPSAAAGSGVAGGTDADHADGSFNLIPTIYGADGTTRALCTVNVDVVEGDDTNSILARAEAALNSSTSCLAGGVTAALDHGGDLLEEDDFDRDDTLFMSALAATGTQLVPAIHAAPGESQDLCFSLFGLRQAVTGHSQPLTFKIVTGPTGSEGGELSLIQESPFGSCAITIATLPGENGFDLAPRMAAAFQSSGIPGPNPECPAESNVRDLRVTADTLSMLFASDVQICTSDAGVGFLMLADGTEGLPPAAVPVVAAATECTGPIGATVVLDGRLSTDPDSTPGTNDDINLFEWFEDFGLASEAALGSGETIMVPLSLGGHALTLRVTDSTGLVDRREVAASVVDTTPPSGAGFSSPDSLYPPNHEMIAVALDVAATDLCGTEVVVALADVVSDEPDDAPGNQDGATTDDIQNGSIGTFDVSVDLRAERDGAASGRTYTLTYDADDGAGNVAQVVIQVAVPLDRDGVVEPILMTAHRDTSGVWFDWVAVSGAGVVTYDVVRGDLAAITDLPNRFDMGPVEWIESASADPSTVSDPDPADPGSGAAFFYLAEYVDDLGGHGYSTLGLKPREVNPPVPVP